MHLADATWTDAHATDTDLALLPVGSTEQHGPHAPLGTDHLTAAAVAEAAAESFETEVLVAPPVPVGVSEEHRQFTGTLWVSPETFRAYVRETIEALVSHGWNRVVIVNGHGGNSAAVGEVAARVSRQESALVVPFTWFDNVNSEFDMGHAGPIETSFLLHRYPELVHEERVPDAAENAADRWGEWVGSTNLTHDPAEFTENGVVGDPSAASATEGESLLESATEALQELLGAIAERDVSRPPHK
jgi:creatinine amidohydrolase